MYGLMNSLTRLRATQLLLLTISILDTCNIAEATTESLFQGFKATPKPFGLIVPTTPQRFHRQFLTRVLILISCLIEYQAPSLTQPVTPPPTSLPHTAPHASEPSPAYENRCNTTQQQSTLLDPPKGQVAPSRVCWRSSFRGQTKTSAAAPAPCHVGVTHQQSSISRAATKPLEANPRFSGLGVAVRERGQIVIVRGGSGHP
uniref:Secreted protein n=1 Tax=Fagus sylvatica TaxID=28930 RepID=A0A2N9FSG4_FAGSY